MLEYTGKLFVFFGNTDGNSIKQAQVHLSNECLPDTLPGIIAGFLPNTQKRSIEETDENSK